MYLGNTGDALQEACVRALVTDPSALLDGQGIEKRKDIGPWIETQKFAQNALRAADDIKPVMNNRHPHRTRLCLEQRPSFGLNFVDLNHIPRHDRSGFGSGQDSNLPGFIAAPNSIVSDISRPALSGAR